MIKAIMAVDEKDGISRGFSMPWPKNSKDLSWFKKNTLNNVVVMGRKTWEDPFMPTPLKNRVNVIITNKEGFKFPNADYCIFGQVNDKIENLNIKYKNKDIFIIGGAEIINLTFDIIQEFYLTRIYGNYNCEKFINVSLIEKNMKLIEKIPGDNSCHFEIWKK
ncbi:dihydrofolate reductase [Pelagibacteraceae bacterium]|nr:dihydrofolate reductase [Pelagibacteraceae bacterium]